jgi:hypothetical protein
MIYHFSPLFEAGYISAEKRLDLNLTHKRFHMEPQNIFSN